MAKKLNISLTITKLLLSIALLQFLVICFHLIPPTDTNVSFFDASLRPYIPEMTEYAALTAAMSYPIGLICEKILKK